MPETLVKMVSKRRNGTARANFVSASLPPSRPTPASSMRQTAWTSSPPSVMVDRHDLRRPPVQSRKDYGNGAHLDDLHRDVYLRWSYAWIDECVRVLKPGGAIFIYILPQWGFHFAAHLERLGMLFRHWIALSMKGTFPVVAALPCTLRPTLFH